MQRYGPDNCYVWMDDGKHTIHVKGETMGGSSVHVDQQGVARFVRGIVNKPKAGRFMHGEGSMKQALEIALEALNHK